MEHQTLHERPAHRCSTIGRAGAYGLCLLIAGALQAQVSSYQFSQSVQPYVEITAADGGWELGSTSTYAQTAYADPDDLAGEFNNGYLDPVIGPGFPIGFNFVFNGDVFDRIGISNYGWIGFGKSSDGDQAVWVHTTDHQAGRPFVDYVNSPVPAYKRNRVAGFGAQGLQPQDMSIVNGPVSSFHVATIGTAPNRVCVVQWSHFRRNFNPDDNDISFQIRLNETTNTVDVRFGEMQWGYLGNNAQVGLGGQNSSDYNSRMTVWEAPFFVHDWNTTARGIDSTSSCIGNDPDLEPAQGPGVYPVVGTNFRWTPLSCPPPTWPLTISDITFAEATATWPDNGATSYDYVVSDINDVTDPTPMMSGSGLTEPSLLITGLAPMTTYYVFIRSHCGAETGVYGEGTSFITQGGGMIVCGDAHLVETYCYGPDETRAWRYTSSDGSSPVRISFSTGYVGSGQLIRIYDGPDATGDVLYAPVGTTTLDGQVFTSLGPDLFMTFTTNGQAGSCQTHDWFTRWNWEAGCVDCAAPLAAFLPVADCDANEFSVQVTVVNLGSASSLTITNSGGAPNVPVNANGAYTVGPFTAGNAVNITLVNPDNDFCNFTGADLVNEPCATVTCGPADETYCYTDGSLGQFLYQSPANERMGIRFRSGSVAYGDVITIYDGLTNTAFPIYNNSTGVDLANMLKVSTAANADHCILLELDADAALSCATANATPWDYVVACYDGCAQPAATFTVVPDCDNDRFSVRVDVSSLGSASSLNITNDGGAAAVTASATGAYTVGPFDSGDHVILEVEGASVLCSLTSPVLTHDCSTGIAEQDAYDALLFYPNPNDGQFRMRLPAGMGTRVELRVQDIAGRVIEQGLLPVGAAREVLVDLGTLSNGTYLATVTGDRTLTGMFRIVR